MSTATPAHRWPKLLAVVVLIACPLLWSGEYLLADRGGFVDEAIPFKQALTLWGWGTSPPTANPHFFSYPSLSIYLSWLGQASAVGLGLLSGRYERAADAGVEYVLDPTYLVTANRIVMICCTIACGLMLYVYWSRRSRAVGFMVGVAFSVTPLVARSTLLMPPEVLLCPLLVMATTASALRIRGHIPAELVVGVLVGLLVGTKLSAAPFGVLAILSCATSPPKSRGYFGIGVRALAAAAITFVATTPFALLDAPAFARDVSFEWGHLHTGHLLGSPTQSIRAHGAQLLDAIGYALPAALIGLPLVWPAVSRASKLALLGALTFLVPAMLSRSGGPERYVLPAIPLLWLVVAEVMHAYQSRSAPLPRLFAGVLALLIGTRVLAAGYDFYHGSAVTPSARATSWLRSHTSPDVLVVQEPGAIALRTKADQLDLANSRSFAAASDRWRTAARTSAWYSVVTLPFVASGDVAANVIDDVGSVVRVRVFSPSWTLMPAVYRALEEVGAQFVVRTESIAVRLGTLYPELGFATGPGGGRRLNLATFSGLNRSVRQDQDVHVESWRGAPRTAPALSGAWWLTGAHFQLVNTSGTAISPEAKPGLVSAAQALVFAERFEPMLLGLAAYSVDSGNIDGAVRAARLILLNDPHNQLAIRVAILGIGEQLSGSVPSGRSHVTLSRGRDERTAAWIGRVLADWGVDPAISRDEIARYANWRPR